MKTSLAKQSLPLKKLFREVEPDIDRIDDRLSRLSQQFNPGINGYVSYATEHSGKRIRAALVMFAGKATGGLKDEHDDLAVIVELIHLASLIHDDILDGAEIRRARPSTNAKWGTEISVLLGDCLFAYALKLCTRFENHDILCKVADASNAVCTGEMLQTQRRFDLKLSVPEYMDMIRMKTGALFEVSTELAAVINQTRPEVASALHVYGESLGTAYQIYDDCLDLAGSESKSGKTLGTDLAKGKLTLPLLHMLNQLSETEKDAVHTEILQGSPESRDELQRRVKKSGGFAYSVRVACRLLEECRKSTRVLQESPHRQHLVAITDSLEERLHSFC